MAMVEIDLPYTYRAKGKYWRFRRGGLDTALPGKPGEAAFHARYDELLAAQNKVPARIPEDSMAWLIRRYRGDRTVFDALSDSTQLDYARTLDVLDAEFGKWPYRLITRPMILAVQSKYAATPRKAHKIKQMLSTLYGYADMHQLVREGFNPTKGLKKPKRKGGEREITVWSDYEIDAYLDTAPDHAKTPVLIALYTGQRREDICRMTWTQFQGDMVRVRQSKTRTMLDIPCHPVLRAWLEGLKRQTITICTNAEGQPYASANALSGVVRRTLASCANIPEHRSMHGLKYAAGSRLEEAGCTIGQIKAILGNRTEAMATKYATQRLRAQEAIQRLQSANK